MRRGPIVAWGAVGAAYVVFQAYVLTRWVTGPYFRAVPAGPSDPPGWMKAAVVGWEIVSWPLLAACLYWFGVRPWRRERRVTTDALLCVVWLSVYFWEPLSSYFTNWFTYNTYAFNRGSWVADVPGWQSFARPGAMVIEPVLWAWPAYCYALFMGTVLTCWVMRRAAERWPGIGVVRLVLCAWAFLFFADVLLEGVLWMPQQLFTTPGALGQVFLGSNANRFGLTEAVFWSAAWASIASVRYFVDDRGLTIAERGAYRLGLGTAADAGARLLALLGLCTTLYIGAYTLPTAVLMGVHSSAWPESITSRSYLNSHICGFDTPRRCPGD